MFSLLRYFSITSLIVFVIVAILLGLIYRRIVLSDLFEMAENKNIALTQSFSNSLWPQFAPFVASTPTLSPAELKTHPQITQLHRAVLKQMEGLSVVKVKVYNLEGLIVFSTDPAQIGEDKRDNQGFLAAQSGQVASELTHRDTFSAFEGVIEDRDVFSSYIPIRRGDLDEPIEAVFEIYDDVTPLVQRIERSQKNIILGSVSILAVLYIILLFVVKRSDNILQDQYAGHRQTEEALAMARDEALEASRLKTQLLANVSHELRTPLNAILGYAEMLQKDVFGPLSTSQSEATTEIIDSTGQLLNFVNNLLGQAQIEAGKVALNKTGFAPAELLDETGAVIGALAQTKGVELIYDIAPDMPAEIYGDPYWLRQILLNLVNNAVKFTEQGTVSVGVYRPDLDHWCIQVTDTGYGIPPEAQTYIFEAFRQMDGTVTRTHGGSGLGLSIVKQLTTLMGGQIILDSEVGQGSTFTILLPLTVAQEETLVKNSN